MKNYLLIKNSKVHDSIMIDEDNLEILEVLKEEFLADSYFVGDFKLITNNSERFITDMVPEREYHFDGEYFYYPSWSFNTLENKMTAPIECPTDELADGLYYCWNEEHQIWLIIDPSIVIIDPSIDNE
jgi:hypothetical protein